MLWNDCVPTCCSLMRLFLVSTSVLSAATVAVCRFSWLRASWVWVSSSITRSRSSFSSAKLATSRNLQTA